MGILGILLVSIALAGCYDVFGPIDKGKEIV
jgi:hypothetical protein